MSKLDIKVERYHDQIIDIFKSTRRELSAKAVSELIKCKHGITRSEMAKILGRIPELEMKDRYRVGKSEEAVITTWGLKNV